MSMICRILGLSPAQIAALRATPSLASDLARVTEQELLRASLATMMSRMPPEKRAAAEAQYRAMMERVPGALEAEAQTAAARGRLDRLGLFEQGLSLEKSWHILHFLLTGHIDDSRAPGDALLTGEALGDDLGYGPPRLHDEAETQGFARFLQTLDVAWLQSRVNYREMARIGVYSMSTGPGSDAAYEAGLQAEVASYFPQLRDYVVKMAEKRHGLLIWLS